MNFRQLLLQRRRGETGFVFNKLAKTGWAVEVEMKSDFFEKENLKIIVAMHAGKIVRIFVLNGLYKNRGISRCQRMNRQMFGAGF